MAAKTHRRSESLPFWARPTAAALFDNLAFLIRNAGAPATVSPLTQTDDYRKGAITVESYWIKPPRPRGGSLRTRAEVRHGVAPKARNSTAQGKATKRPQPWVVRAMDISPARHARQAKPYGGAESAAQQSPGRKPRERFSPIASPARAAQRLCRSFRA
jgi:hypothetical protein